MENFKVILVDEDVIGYKDDIIKHLRHELAYIAEDKTVDNYILSDITETIKKLDEDRNVGNNTLLRLFVHPMGGFGYTECEVVDVED